MGTKQKKSKKEVVAEVTALNRGELKSMEGSQKSENHQAKADEKPKRKQTKPDNPQEWLASYCQDVSKSGAKLVTALFSKPEGCSIEDASKQALELAKSKSSKWGSIAHVRSHLTFLKSKGCTVTDLGENKFKVS